MIERAVEQLRIAIEKNTEVIERLLSHTQTVASAQSALTQSASVSTQASAPGSMPHISEVGAVQVDDVPSFAPLPTFEDPPPAEIVGYTPRATTVAELQKIVMEFYTKAKDKTAFGNAMTEKLASIGVKSISTVPADKLHDVEICAHGLTK